MNDKAKCKNCGHVIEIDMTEARKMLNNIRQIVNNNTNKMVKQLGNLTVFNKCIDCCDAPDYEYDF